LIVVWLYGRKLILMPKRRRGRREYIGQMVRGMMIWMERGAGKRRNGNV
jgi:hypothetical protein